MMKSEEYILAILEKDGRINVSATGKHIVTELEAAEIRDEFIVTRQDKPNLEAILRRL